MIRHLYTLLFALAQPLVWARLAWRARQQPGYLQHFGERLGRYGAPPNAPVLWLHAVSLGETRAAEPLVKALLDAYPDHLLLLTHMTPTGRAAGADLMQRLGPRVLQAYLPYDLPGACGRFFAHFRPRIGLLMETELWPNLIATARRRSVPVLLVNARLSEKSQRGYRRFLPLIRPTVQDLTAVAAQTPADAARLETLGASAIHVTGNLKFDVTPAPDKRALGAEWRAAFAGRPVWLAASTREGEEALIIEAFAQCDWPQALLLLVPRHPQRFDDVADLLARRGVPFCRRGRGEFPTPDTRVWLGDSMGEMPAYFSAADLALIGGTLLPFGGQNLIEAAACGCPVLVGPHTYNFAQATQDALACGAARPVLDAAEATNTAKRLLEGGEALATMRAAASAFSLAHRGATERTLAIVRNTLR